MNTKRIFLNLSLCCLLATPMYAMSATLGSSTTPAIDDGTLQKMLGAAPNKVTEQLSSDSQTTNKAENKDDSLLYDPESVLKKSKQDEDLREQSNRLTLQIDIAKKNKQLHDLQDAQPLAAALKKVDELQQQIAALRSQLDATNVQLAQKDHQIVQLQSKLKSEDSDISTHAPGFKAVSNFDVLNQIQISRISIQGHHKSVNVLYGVTVITRNEGDVIDGNIRIKKINFDNVVITDGKNTRTYFATDQQIAEHEVTSH